MGSKTLTIIVPKTPELQLSNVFGLVSLYGRSDFEC